MVIPAAGAGGGAVDSPGLGLTGLSGLGAASLIGGTILNADANRRRTGALNTALNRREGESSGFNQQREGILAGQQQATLAGGRQSDQNLLAFAQGLQGQQGGFEQGQQQGLLDIQAGQDFIGGQSPNLFAANANPNQVAQTQGFQAQQQQPLSDALLALDANQLGQLQQQQQLGDVRQQGQLSSARLQNILGTNQREAAVGSSQVDLNDLLSNLQFQNATQRASQVGGRTQAFGGLLQSVGGGLIGN